MAAVNRSAGGLWVAKQNSKGTAASTMRKQLPLIEGGLSPMSESATRRWLDGKRFGKKISFKKQTMVGGEITVLCTPEALAFIESCIHDNDTIDSGSPNIHTLTSAADESPWLTFIQRVGTGSDLLRDKFVDCRLVSYEINGSAGSDDPVTITCSIIGLTVETAQSADPTPLDDPNDESEPYCWTDIAGSVTANGLDLPNISQLSLSVSTGEELYFSDSITAYDIVQGEPEISAAATLLVDSTGLAIWNQIHYGTFTPAEGDTISTEELKAAVEFSWSYDQRSATYYLPNVTLTSDSEMTPSPEGGALELSIAGMVEEADDGSPALTVDHATSDSTSY